VFNIDMSNSEKWGGWLLIVAAVIGLLVALYDFFLAWGIRYSIGSGIVVFSTAIMIVAALVIVFARPARWVRIVLGIGLVLDFLGTALAAYFLDSYLLTALSLLAGLGWLIFALSLAPARQEQPA
jgi:hypothetical protein